MSRVAPKVRRPEVGNGAARQREIARRFARELDVDGSRVMLEREFEASDRPDGCHVKQARGPCAGIGSREDRDLVRAREAGSFRLVRDGQAVDVTQEFDHER